MTARPSRKRPTSTTLIAQPEALVPNGHTPPVEQAPPQPEQEPSSTDENSLEPATPEPAYVKRAIQLHAPVAESYDEQLFTLHARHRKQKNRIQSAMIAVALRHLNEVEELLQK